MYKSPNAMPVNYQVMSAQMMGQPIPQAYSSQKQLPETLEDLYNLKLDRIDRALKNREEKNCGRRMASCTSEYSSPATHGIGFLRK